MFEYIRKSLFGLLLLLSVPCFALRVECVGTAIQTINQGDTVFVFAEEIAMRTKDGMPANWYKTDGTLAQSNTADVFLDNGGYYIETGGIRDYFYVFSYADYRPQNIVLSVQANCRDTRLTVSGTLPEMTYLSPAGMRTLPRTCSLSYTDLAWNSSDLQWQDSAVILTDQTFRLGEYALPAIYKATDICLCYEPIAVQLGLEQDSVCIALTDPIAVKSMPTTQTTVRGTEMENEVDRPTDASVLTGSAPIDVLFKANPTPAVDYFSWTIYKGSRLVVSRTDEEHRYTFNEPGSYRVVCTVSNATCPCLDTEDPDCERDSTEITIAVSESQLLVPNVFTPNGDGKNDEFRVLYRSIKEFHCWVYNRWGKLVYEWTDPAKGWDGTINGRPAAEGAYFYVIRALGTDAASNAQYTSKIKYTKAKNNAADTSIGIYQLSGDINLIRGK